MSAVTDGYWSDTAKVSIFIGALPRYHLSITTVNGTVTPQPVGPDYDSGANGGSHGNAQ